MTRATLHPRRRAYTLAELLVVISIFVLVLAIAVPAFSSLIYSTERSQAENQIGIALGSARAAAMSSEGLGDCAAVFFYDPETQRTRIGVYSVAGQLNDVDPNDSTKTIARDVFVPMPAYQPLQMPRNWMVRAYAPPGSIDTGSAGALNGWYEEVNGRAYDETTGNWVFPETGFYDPDRADSGDNRQTFMVRFEAGTGILSTSNRGLALVVDPSESKEFRTGTFGKAPYRLDTPEDLAARVRRMLSPGANLTARERQQLLGDEATDTVLARPVAELAFYDERRLASAVGARSINGATGSLYGSAADPRSIPDRPSIDSSLVKNTGAALAAEIGDWIQGTGDSSVASDARIFTIDRFLGRPREVLP